MDKKIRIVLVEDHTILREGLRALLSADPKFEIIGEADDGRQAIRRVDNLAPDLVVMDLSMPRMTGMDAIREIKRRHPATKIIALTVHKAEEYLRTTLQAGADGYVLKDATHVELLLAIQNVLAGKTYLSPSVSDTVIEGYLGGKEDQIPSPRLGVLSPREREVLKLIAEGYKNKEIAGDLFISLKTVEKHRANLMKKLDLHNAAALTAFAIEQGLI
ncbi:MAG: response regulator transcription factor [Deltaproteobacteria bacterium]|jgi:DNA-binding NarL/FixJ family response regulator|nr:response regulator transcription factor [Deltaproteobacteria bacterium]